MEVLGVLESRIWDILSFRRLLAWHLTGLGVRGAYWGYIGILEKKMESTIIGYVMEV